MAGTTHRFERHDTVIGNHREHVLAELFPVSAPYPKLTRQKLGCPDFSIAEPAHFPSDVIFQTSVNGVAAWVPKYHARHVLLDVPEVELVSQASMIEIVH